MMLRLAVRFLLPVAACLLSVAGVAYAQPAPTPLVDGLVHKGVASCTTAGCHGDQVSGRGLGPVVGQNEYFIWRSPFQQGAHSRAYDVLLSPLGKRIANNLGIGPAEEAGECLACHADNVPAALRSDRFQITDGVGCEACHGGSEKWLTAHRQGDNHAANVANGLYPTELPTDRARMCLGCHLGSSIDNQFVSHRIMGAGHPRLKFELDLYTAVQQHHTVDEDYAARKTVAPGAQVWLVGQTMALQRTLNLLIDPQTGVDGVFPEFVFFDCHACHQTITSTEKGLNWRPNPARGLGPGMVVLNDANYIMLLAAAKVIDPALARRLERDGKALHRATQQGRSAMVKAARTLNATSEEFMAGAMAADYSDKALVRAMLREIIGATTTRRYTNYAAAEQALFAVQRLAAALDARTAGVSDVIQEASRYAENPYTYNQSAFRRALQKLNGKI